MNRCLALVRTGISSVADVGITIEHVSRIRRGYSTRYPFDVRQVFRMALMVVRPCNARAWSAGLCEPELNGNGELWL